jgi:hypothetical protein
MMTRLIIGSRHLLAVFVVALFGMSALATAAFAQDATETPATTVVTHPAHVHKGTCAQLDPNPAYPLDNVGPRLTDDDKMPDTEDIKGSLTANPVEYSQTEIDVSLDDLLKESYAINVHESDQNIATYIACGDIGGPVLDDKLYIGLNQQNDSGYYGVATLEKKDDKTEVTVYLFNSKSPQAEGTPVA